jgi:hypothetical protein
MENQDARPDKTPKRRVRKIKIEMPEAAVPPAPEPVAPPEPQPPEPQLTADQIIAGQAENLRDMTGAIQFAVAVSNSLTPDITTEAFKLYRKRLLKEAGSPTDPIEVMLVEQLALANFHIGRLHMKSCTTEHGPLAIAYADAATRLTAEFRRSALALEDYRAKQLARKEGRVADSTPEEAEPTKPDHRSGKKTTRDKLQNQETPRWLRKRMSPTMEESGLVASVN